MKFIAILAVLLCTTASNQSLFKGVAGMVLRSTLVLLVALFASGAESAILEVGSGKPYTTIAAAARAARSGDTIHIHPGTYTAGAVFTADNLTIKAAPGTPRGKVIVKTGVVNNKALFNIKGDNNVVENIRFNFAKVKDGNGAGIRAEGHGLTVRDSIFYKNEMGVLITPFSDAESGGTYQVVNSTFSYTESKVAGHIGHGIYAATDRVQALIVEDSTFSRGVKGHYIKSRAQSTTVTNSKIDDTSGSASYLIEMPEGGAATIAGNTLIKGSKASNCCIAIAYGTEMYKGGTYVNAPGPVLISDNDFTNKRNSTVRFVENRSAPANPVILTGNSLVAQAGSVIALSGPGSVDGAPKAAALADALGFDPGFIGSDDSLSSFSLAFAAPLQQLPAPATLPLFLAGAALISLGQRRRR